jgi:O-antigen ligase
MRINWGEPKVVVAIIVLAIFLIGMFMGKIVTGFPYKVPLVLALSTLIFVITLVNTDAGLAVLIFSMLLSPEIVVGEVPGREIVIRFDDLMLIVITLAFMICLIATLRGAALGYVVPEKGLFYVLRYVEYFLLYILVVNHIHSRKQIKFFLNAFFITCAVVSVYGILQIPTGKRVSAPFEGQVGEPNTFGGYLLFILCIAMGLWLKKVPKNLRFALTGLIVLISLPFLYTLSRASYIAVIFSFIVFILLSKKKLLLTAATVLLAVLILAVKPEAFFSRVKYTFQEKESRLARIGDIYLDQSSSARIFSWEDSFESWKKKPILGRGISGLGLIDGQYIRTLPELGIVGLAAFIWLLLSILRHSYKVHKQMDDELYKGLSLGFIAGFIGLAIHALTANTFIILRIMEPFWFIAGMVMMLPTLEEEESLKTNNLL